MGLFWPHPKLRPYKKDEVELEDDDYPIRHCLSALLGKGEQSSAMETDLEPMQTEEVNSSLYYIIQFFGTYWFRSLKVLANCNSYYGANEARMSDSCRY